jgi:hypothetical protein
MPFVAKSVGTVTGAEFPERCVPGSAVAITRRWAGGDKPAFDGFLHKAGIEEALAVDSCQVFGLENTAAVSLENAQTAQGGGQLLVRGGHVILQVYFVVEPQVNDVVEVQVYYVVPIQVYSASISL